MKKLARRETELLLLLAQGFTNQEAADVMRVSVKTTETYRVRICTKLGFKTRAALFRYAFDTGMLKTHQLAKDVPGYSRKS